MWKVEIEEKMRDWREDEVPLEMWKVENDRKIRVIQNVQTSLKLSFLLQLNGS